MKKNILFISIGEEHRASSRFRVWQMAPHLTDAGATCRIIPYIRSSGGEGLVAALKRRLTSSIQVEKEIRQNLDWADVVVIQEALLSLSLLRNIKLANKQVIFDFSDPLHLMHLDTGLSWLKRAFFYLVQRPKFNLSLKIADHAFVENDSLTAVTDKYDCDTVVMRGPVDCQSFSPIDKSGSDEVVLGWTGSAATFDFLKPLFPLIDKLGETNKLKLILVGCGEQDIDLKNVTVEIEPWTLENERAVVPKYDIGLFNLNDSVWDRARGGGKLFVYMACGVPFISPDIGIGRQVYQESKSGMLVEKGSEWQQVLLTFIEDTKMRNQLAATARQYAQNNYSHQAYLKTWLRIIGM
jgi:glycosyltransferase involved in cell wall biosynthesis